MKREMKSRIVLASIFIGMLTLIGAGATTVSAEQWIDVDVGGIDLGWIMLGIGGIIAIPVLGHLAGVVTIPKGAGAAGILAFFLVAGGMVVVYAEVDGTDTTATVTDSDCCDFEITGAAITGVGDYITSTWDEDTNSLTIPLTVSDSSDGNLTGSAGGVNITIEALGSTTDNNCVFTITSDDSMTYGGEDVLDKTSSNYRAEITTSEGTEYGDDKVQVTAGSTDWANCSWFFKNGTSGSWVSELSQVGDTVTWYLTVENECGTKETVTVKAIVVSYTA